MHRLRFRLRHLPRTARHAMSAWREGHAEQSLTMRSISFKMSLQSLLLLVTLSGVTLAYCLSRVTIRELRIRNYVLEQRIEWDRKRSGYVNVIDPSKGYVRRLGSSGRMVWRYRLRLPADHTFQLMFAQKWNPDGTPVAQNLGPTLQRSGSSTGQIVTVAFRSDGGRWSYHVSGPSFGERNGTVEGDMAWAIPYDHVRGHLFGGPDGSTLGGVKWAPAKYDHDHSEQLEFDPHQTLVLFASGRPGRPGGNLSTLTSGISLWICPIDANDRTK